MAHFYQIKVGDILLNKFGQPITAYQPLPGKGLWLYKCYCGNIFKGLRSKILDGTVSSCGCYRRRFQSPFKEGQIIRNAANRPIQALHSNKDGTWWFKCYCGRQFNAQASRIVNTSRSQIDILSCGCHKRSKYDERYKLLV